MSNYRLPTTPATSADMYAHAIVQELRRLNKSIEQLAAVLAPAEVARETNLREPAAGRAPEPWPGYIDATVEEIVARLRDMEESERERALAFERANKNRVGITRVNWNS